MFWPDEDRYWCRQCKAQGDAIQFCRDFHGLPFHVARLKVEGGMANRDLRTEGLPRPSVQIRSPSRSWVERAGSFVKEAHTRLLIDPGVKDTLFQRGLCIDTLTRHRIGWNPVNTFRLRSDWGLDEEKQRKWLCLPAGFVIPVFEASSVKKVKIRKSEWKEGDLYGKYYEVPGSSSILPLFGDPAIEATVVVEAEFDALLIIQEAGDLCNCLALGGASKKPHLALHEWLLGRKVLFFALDFDEGGKKEFAYWQRVYPSLEPWPVPNEKSPGDFYVSGGCIRAWISSGLKLAQGIV